MSLAAFDPGACADALEALAAVAPSYAAPLSTLRPQSVIVREAAKLLGPACAWLKKAVSGLSWGVDSSRGD